MILTISTTRNPATDLGYLLHKHPGRVQTFDLAFGSAHVTYPEATAERCTAALWLDTDPVALARSGRASPTFALGQYVNDKPYAANSLLATAVAQVFGSALSGKSAARPELVDERLPLEIRLPVLPVRGPSSLPIDLFGPLGYEVNADRLSLDSAFPEWGESNYFDVTLRTRSTLSTALNHLYVLIPVFDDAKHYYAGTDEVEKLLDKGREWLPSHPMRDFITRRYLRHRRDLTGDAIGRMGDADEEIVPRDPTLNEVRHSVVFEELRRSGAASVLDLGCGEGRMVERLLGEKQFQKIVGVDASSRVLSQAARRLERLPEMVRTRAELWHAPLTYRDCRLEGFDAAALVEVVEHLDPDKLARARGQRVRVCQAGHGRRDDAEPRV